MNPADHLAAFEVHKETIFVWAVGTYGADRAQRVIGLHASCGIVELLSTFLHRAKLVDDGFQLNHRWFKSATVERRLPEFPGRDAIVERLVRLELLSEALAYGSPGQSRKLAEALELFQELEKRIKELP